MISKICPTCNGEFIGKNAYCSRECRYSSAKQKGIGKAMGLGQKGVKFSEEHKRKISEANKGKIFSLETRKKMSIAAKKRIANRPKGYKSHMIGKKLSAETRAKISAANKGRKMPIAVRKKISERNIGRKSPDSVRKAVALANKNRVWKQSSRDSISKKFKEYWKSEEFVKKIQESRAIKPNKPEKKILNLLDRIYPNEWKYTGDFSFMVDGKSPDFTNCNGKKLLIEHYGTYWHRGDDPEDRKAIFRKFGYRTLVIWENELKDSIALETTIKDFVESDGRY